MAGLGNPGPRYERTRHNVGFMVIDELARTLGAPPFRKKNGALEAKVADRNLVLAKPQSFMNESGWPVSRVASWWKVPVAALLVVYDDLDLPFGRLRLRASGSSGGHNGMKSVIEALGSEGFARLRIGIGRGGDAIDRVLAPFEAGEQALLAHVLAAASEAATRWLDEPFALSSQWANSWRNSIAPASPEP